MKSYRLDRTHRVIELRGVTRSDDALAAEQQVRTLLRRCDTPAAIVDVDSEEVSPSLVSLLVRLRGFAERCRVFLCVRARHEQVAEALREAGLERILRVTRTLSQARERTRVCCAATSPRRPASTVRARLKVRLYRFVCPDTKERTAAARQSHACDLR
ncbi:anti-sigma factor antagonist [Streptomyces rishiriensis]|uniref:anti-sigma factor antagonist n=1 Tax=Streptomyces rishiriensis TaxID=68264 RepID=UPI0027D8F285|nr:anti-sigma factor antagonist [Streptomyces rishiriensis]